MPIDIIQQRVIHQREQIRYIETQARYPNGAAITKTHLDHPGAVGILPVLDDGRVVLLSQYRLALGTSILEIPAGTLEPNESPRACAERELQEEAGYLPGKLTAWGTFYLAPGLSNELMHLFLAEDLRPSQLDSDADELITLQPMTLAEALGKIKSGQIRDAKTLIGLLQLANRA